MLSGPHRKHPSCSPFSTVIVAVVAVAVAEKAILIPGQQSTLRKDIRRSHFSSRGHSGHSITRTLQLINKNEKSCHVTRRRRRRRTTRSTLSGGIHQAELFRKLYQSFSMTGSFLVIAEEHLQENQDNVVNSGALIYCILSAVNEGKGACCCCWRV